MKWILVSTGVLKAFLSDGVKHFSLAFFLGLAAYSLTWIIGYAPLCIMSRLTRRRIPSVVVFGILICGLLLGISFALGSHFSLDFTSSWWYEPLGPPLILRTPVP